MINPWKALLFDLDNTLLDRTLTFSKFTDKLLDTFATALTTDEKNRWSSLIIELDNDGYKNKKELFHDILPLLPWKDKLAADQLWDFYTREYPANAELMQGTRKLLDYCKGKYSLGLITNGLTEIQYGKIDILGIRGYFDVILVSEQAGVKKPDRTIFEMALMKLNMKPTESLYVGDHPKNDIEGAASAGMKSIWMKRNQPWPESVTVKPIHTVSSVHELLSYLKEQTNENSADPV
ncbi:HAD family hydrolase [Paenibacillus gansuensis]|uniref:HAD family hydrolase n=1 Tax=Paenibacillus gansuensis TaxID=306542 RepID=A0ABW5PD90_9BACL